MRAQRFITAAAILIFAGTSTIVTAAPAQAQSSTSTKSTNGAFSSDKTPAAVIAPQKSAPLDLNASEEDEFASLPGVGKHLAHKIVAGRPYKSKHELLDRKVVSAKVYEHIKTLVTVKN